MENFHLDFKSFCYYDYTVLKLCKLQLEYFKHCLLVYIVIGFANLLNRAD